MTRTPPAEFLEQAAEAGIVFDSGDLDRLGAFLERLLEVNERMNLTAIRDSGTAWSRHVFDSLTLLGPLAALEAREVLDVGSGGGLPGIPLAIACPEIEVTLLEATAKKARFLEETVAALNLANVTVVNERAETAGADHHGLRERFDVVMARAVGPLPVLLELTVPFARIGGVVLAIKGARAPEEIEAARGALHMLHAAVTDSLSTPTGTIVVIEKRRKTPRTYPRRPGEPKRRPLGVPVR